MGKNSEKRRKRGRGNRPHKNNTTLEEDAVITQDTQLAETTDLDQNQTQVMTQEIPEPTPVWEGEQENPAELKEAEEQSVVEDQDAALPNNSAEVQDVEGQSVIEDEDVAPSTSSKPKKTKKKGRPHKARPSKNELLQKLLALPVDEDEEIPALKTPCYECLKRNKRISEVTTRLRICLMRYRHEAYDPFTTKHFFPIYEEVEYLIQNPKEVERPPPPIPAKDRAANIGQQILKDMVTKTEQEQLKDELKQELAKLKPNRKKSKKRTYSEMEGVGGVETGGHDAEGQIMDDD
ncbi:hypothetical protein V8F20_012863 [Naviculisporaceae sp. PSN 640]